MQDLELFIDYVKLIAGINDFIDEGKKLGEVQPPVNINDIPQYIAQKKNWDNRCYNFLATSFSGNQRLFFANAFISERTPNITPVPPFHQAKTEYNNLIKRIGNLKLYIELLELSDSLKYPEIVKKEDRVNWTIKQKKNLLLEKLNSLYGRYLSISYIFWANDILSENPQEQVEIANSLESLGYITLRPSKDTTACLTADGKEYIESQIERKNETKKSSFNNTRANQEEYNSELYSKYDFDEMNAKIDMILEKLNRTEMGEEIIFDEIQELKDYIEVLNKKNFTQLLKGKLLDLVNTKITGLSVEAAKHIFQDLTGMNIDKLIG